MLYHVPTGIPPVIKDLRAQDVTPDAPDALVPLFGEPLMAQLLGIEIVDLERAVVDVAGGWI